MPDPDSQPDPRPDQQLAAAAAEWDEAAATFDQDADHGLRDPQTRAAWAALLAEVLPEPPLDVADLGCGTGSLSVLLAEAGHRVTGVDVSARMLEQARAKAAAASVSVRYVEGDAAQPGLAERSQDVILCRHVLWALPDPAGALGHWAGLLRPGGFIVLVEGKWSTGSGLTARELVDIAGTVPSVRVERHAPLVDPSYWGRRIDDERYLVVLEPVAAHGDSSSTKTKTGPRA